MIGNSRPMIKVAIMIGQLERDGSERQLCFFLKHCNRKLWSPIVYVSGALGPCGDSIRELGIPVKLLHGSPTMKMRHFRQWCKANPVRRFFSWSSYTNGYGLALLGLCNARVGSLRNDYLMDLPSRHRWLWSWMSLAGVSTVVCNSQETVASVRSRVGGRKRVVYVPNSVQPVENVEFHRKTWRKRLGVPEEETLVLGAGRLAAQKNFARFIETVALVHQTIPIRAVVAGRDDGLLESLQQQVDASGLGSHVIKFIGAVPDARELMCAADVFLLSSDYEGMPNVVLEAMVADVPCVCTEVNGVSVLIENGVNGFIVDRRADALAEKVLLLARDQKLRKKMGVRAAARMKGSFTPEIIAARLWQLLE